MYSVVLMMAIGGSADLADRGCCRCSCACSCSCRCNGCHGCCGCSCRGRCHGCHGRRCHGCHACHGCCGCHAVVTCHGCAGCACAAPAAPKGKAEIEAPATIVVSLPADARLSVDGNGTTSTSDRRTFTTPVLPTAEQFQYTLRAEIVRDGRTIVETQTVNVRGGQETAVPFNFSSTGVASAR